MKIENQNTILELLLLIEKRIQSQNFDGDDILLKNKLIKLLNA